MTFDKFFKEKPKFILLWSNNNFNTFDIYMLDEKQPKSKYKELRYKPLNSLNKYPYWAHIYSYWNIKATAQTYEEITKIKNQKEKEIEDKLNNV